MACGRIPAWRPKRTTWAEASLVGKVGTGTRSSWLADASLHGRPSKARRTRVSLVGLVSFIPNASPSNEAHGAARARVQPVHARRTSRAKDFLLTLAD